MSTENLNHLSQNQNNYENQKNKNEDFHLENNLKKLY